MGHNNSKPKPPKLPPIHKPHLPKMPKTPIDKMEEPFKKGHGTTTNKKTCERGLTELANGPATITQKKDFMVEKLDDGTDGCGSTALAVAVPEVFAMRAVAQGVVDIQNGKPPKDASMHDCWNCFN